MHDHFQPRNASRRELLETDRLARSALVMAIEGLVLTEQATAMLASGVGGVVVLGRNVSSSEQLTELTSQIKTANPDALVVIDEEGGTVSRLNKVHGGFPSAQALGSVDDPGLTTDIAHLLGNVLNRHGIDMCLAPNADLAAVPGNPVVGSRSFGRDPEQVSRHVVAFIAGLRQAGVGSCVKHFPGHGLTTTDSHEHYSETGFDEPVLSHLAPFQAAISAGVDAVMPGHLVVSSWDAEPASMSTTAIAEKLRGELGFGGLIISDAVDMAGTRRGLASAAVAALGAGNNLVLLGNKPTTQSQLEEVTAAIGIAIVRGDIPTEQVGQWRWPTAQTQPPAPLPPDRRSQVAHLALSLAQLPDQSPTDILILEPEWISQLDIDPSELSVSISEAFADLRIWRAFPSQDQRTAIATVTESSLDRHWMVVTADTAFDQKALATIERIVARRPNTMIVEAGIPAQTLPRPHALMRGTGTQAAQALAKALGYGEKEEQ